MAGSREGSLTTLQTLRSVVPVLEVRTVVHRPADVVFDALVDLGRFEEYSDHLASIDRDGTGGVDTEYTITVAWWLVTYTLRARVTGVDPPNRLDFEVTEGITATGSWHIDPVSTEHSNTVSGIDGESAVNVSLVVDYDPDSASGSAMRLPGFVSVDWIVDRVAPLVEREVHAVVQAIVRDLEGSQRDVDLEVEIR